jgi:phosphoglycolate phosphatase-like HAD superfamily hydrolase
MVGDREADIDAGLNAQIRAAGVCTGKYDAKTWAAVRPGVPVFPSFVEFVASLEQPSPAVR